jgi:hypothetical protein
MSEGIINVNRAPYSTVGWVTVKTYDPDTSFGPMSPEMAHSYVRVRGGEVAGFFIVRDSLHDDE